MIATDTEIAYFMEMFETRHFTQAAVKLGVSQSALTQSISKLENKVDAQLFHRTKRGCLPTEAGKLFFKEAQRLREDWNQLTDAIQKNQRELSGKFRVGCHPSLGIYALPALFKLLHQRAPGIEILLVHDYARNLTEKVIAYELDLALVVNPVRQADLVLKKIFEDRIGIWQAKGKKNLPEQIFTDMKRMQVDELLGKRALDFRNWKITQTSSLELVHAMVKQGAGIGILPERVARAEETGLEFYDKTLPTSRDEIHVIHRSDCLKTNAGRLLLEVTRACF